MKKLFCLIFIAASVACFSQSDFCTVKSGLFSDPTVWNLNVVPDSTDNISVNSGDTLFLCNSRTVSNVNISTGSLLKVDSAVVFTVRGNWINSGKFIGRESTVRFNGNSLQSIGGYSVTTFFNLECNNCSGITITKDQKITNLLTVSQGTVNLNSSKLILLSDSNLTGAIGPLLNGADIQGKITMQRYIDGTVTGWRFLGSPVNTRLSDWKADFLTSGFPGSAYPNYYFCSIYKYDETVWGTSEFGYTAPTHVNDSLKPGRGYWCWVGPAPDLVDVTGFLKKGNHVFDVSMTPNAGKTHDGWNLVANPYPSSIDWDSDHWTKIGIQNAIYIWDPETEQYSTYINGIGINGGTNIIASSQAFWVQANQNNPVLMSSEKVKTQQQLDIKRRIPVSALKLCINGNGGTDETVVAFRADATAAVESDKDAVKLFTDNPLVPSLSTISDTTDLAVNFLPEMLTAGVAVKVKVGASGTYSLSGKGFTFPGDRCVFLEDLVTGSLIDVKSEFNYAFFISDTTKAPRFLIHVTSPLQNRVSKPQCSYLQNGKIIIECNTGSCSVNWFDGGDNLIASNVSTSGMDSLLNLAAGFYSVKVNTGLAHCPVLNQKMQIESIAPLHVNALVTGNYCRNTRKGSIHLNGISGGTAPYLSIWQDGDEHGDRTNLPGGEYTLVISDANNCRDTVSYAINSESLLESKFSLYNDTSSVFQYARLKLRNESIAFTEAKWLADDRIFYENDPEFSFSIPGTHTISLIVKDLECSSEQKMIVNVKPLHLNYGLDETPEIFLSNEEAVIAFKNPENASYTISVFTADGKQIYERQVETPKGVLSFPLGESHGMYVVKCESNGLVSTNKLIK